MQQLIPYERLAEHMNDVYGIPLSTGSIRNFIKEAAERLRQFEIWLKCTLILVHVLYTDMTSINVSGKQSYASIYCTIRKKRDKRVERYKKIIRWK